MKTRQPLIVTAKIAETVIDQFDHLRQKHFPLPLALSAHLNMFHRQPCRGRDKFRGPLMNASTQAEMMTAKSAAKTFGAGVAFVITCRALEGIRERLKNELGASLGTQDMQIAHHWPEQDVEGKN